MPPTQVNNVATPLQIEELDRYRIEPPPHGTHHTVAKARGANPFLLGVSEEDWVKAFNSEDSLIKDRSKAKQARDIGTTRLKAILRIQGRNPEAQLAPLPEPIPQPIPPRIKLFVDTSEPYHSRGPLPININVPDSEFIKAQSLPPSHFHPPKSNMASEDDSESFLSDDTLWCDCRGLDEGSTMVRCDNFKIGRCYEWYHFKCYGISEHDGEKLLRAFYCKTCKAANPLLKDRYKPYCLYGKISDCREPVGTFLKKNGETTQSRYCSPEHSRKYLAHQFGELSDDPNPTPGGALTKKEFATMIAATGSLEEFQALGARPMIEVGPDFDYNTIMNEEQQGKLVNIHNKRAEATRLKQIWKDIHDRLVWIVKKSLEVRKATGDFKRACGYSSLLAVNEDEFEVWKASPAGVKAFENKEIESEETFCTKMKCGTHFDWYKMQQEELEMENGQLDAELEKLDKMERNLKEHVRTYAATKDYINLPGQPLDDSVDAQDAEPSTSSKD